jgi:hypothetical protein
MMGLAGGLGETGRFLEDRRKYLTEEEREAEEKRRWEEQMRQSGEHFDKNMALQSGIHTQNKLNQDRQFGLDQARQGADLAQRGLENRRTEGRDILAGLRDVGISGGNPLAVLEGVNRGKAVNLANMTMQGGRGDVAPMLDAMQRAAPGVRSKLPSSDQKSAGFIPGSDYFGGLSAIREPFSPNTNAGYYGYMGRTQTDVTDFIEKALSEARLRGDKASQNFLNSRSGMDKKFERLNSRSANSVASTEYQRALEYFDQIGRRRFGDMWPGLVEAAQSPQARPATPALNSVRSSPRPAPATPRDTAPGGNPFLSNVRGAVKSPAPSNPFLR